MDNNVNQGQAPANPPVQPTQSAMTPSPAPKKGMSKGLLWGIIGGSIGLVLLIVGVILAVVFLSGPTKKDYAQAVDQYKKISDEVFNINLKDSSLYYGLRSSTENSFKNDVEDINKSLDKIKQYNQELGEMKAVKKGPAKEPYDKFNTKVEKFVNYMKDFSNSILAFKEGFGKCDEALDGGSSVTANTINKCAADLGEAEKKITNKTLKEYVAKFKSEMKNMAELYTKVKAIKNPYGSDYKTYSALKKQLYAAQDRMNDASKDFKSNIEKEIKEIDLKDESNELSSILRENAI